MKKTFLILFSAIFATLLSSCEKETPISVDTFNTFVEDALAGSVRIIRATRYVDGEMGETLRGDHSRMSQTTVLLFYPDGTCRKCYSNNLLEHEESYYSFYRTLYWEADVERRVIRLTDEALREAGSAFAVTELQLTNRRFRDITLKGMIPEPLDLSDDKYAAAKDVYYILDGFVRAVDDRTYVEAEYRSDVEDPRL